MTKPGKRVAVFMGGWNGEREVSLSSGREVAKILAERGYVVQTIDVQQDIRLLVEALTPKPDVAFICSIHGKWFEDGCLQGLLELMGIAYTNSGPLASAIAMNKNMARTLFQNAGIPVPEGGFYHRDDFVRGPVMEMPFVVKPVAEGSSLGVHIIRKPDDLGKLEETFRYGDYVIAEKYIPGREIQVLVMGDRGVGTVEVRAKDGFCDYDAKYVKGMSDRIAPAPLCTDATREALELAVRASRVLGCEGLVRVDLRYDDTGGEPGKFYILEVNTQPGMTPTSFAPLIAAAQGISFGDLVEWMVENPRCPL